MDMYRPAHLDLNILSCLIPFSRPHDTGVLLTGNRGQIFVPPHLRLLHVAKEPQSIPEMDIFSIFDYEIL